MAEYTYKDVIIDPQDPRVEIGKEYWMDNIPSECLRSANEDKATLALNKIEPNRPWPFYSTKSGSCVCIIRKKEPEKKYVPFNLDKPEIRQEIKGVWIRKKDNSEIKLIWWFWKNPFDEKWVIDEDISPEELLADWVFDIDGTPCGKLVEE